MFMCEFFVCASVLEPSQINYHKRAQIYQRKKYWKKMLRDLDSSVAADPKFAKVR